MAQSVNRQKKKRKKRVCGVYIFVISFPSHFLIFLPFFFFFFPVVPTNFDSFVPLKNCAVKERREKEKKKKRPGGTNNEAT